MSQLRGRGGCVGNEVKEMRGMELNDFKGLIFKTLMQKILLYWKRNRPTDVVGEGQSLMPLVAPKMENKQQMK